MERGKSTEAVHGEIHLHEPLIQHIQSFLSCKEAAQTSILCKTWYNAWATRPIVDLDGRHFQSRGDADPGTRRRIADGFLEYSKRIIRRYEDSNLKIDNFRFCMKGIRPYCFSPVNELIADAMKLGACDVKVEIFPRATEFELPHEVLRSKNLVRLSVFGCRINFDAMGGKVVFSKLKSLSLRGVCIVGYPALDIASSCPLIEELVLSKCTCTYNGNTSVLALGSLNEFEKQSLGLIVDAPIRPYDNLKCLYLKMSRIDKLLFSDMSRYFPCLKDLTFSRCYDYTRLQLYSPSLEFLSLDHMIMTGEIFDFPSLRKFTFSGITIPDLSFEATSREWESDISITCTQDYITTTSWLDTLKSFLMKLSSSKISLYLCFGLFPCLPEPELENLKLSMDEDPTPVCSSLLKGVYLTCRPKFITLDLRPQFPFGREEICDMVELLCKTLVEEESESCCIPSRHMSDIYDLEKVDVNVFADSLAEWQLIPWEILVDSSESQKKQEFRFKLRWRQNPSSNTLRKELSFIIFVSFS